MLKNVKDAVFAEILVFSNNFGFPAVNWAQKWTKTVNFECVSFESNFEMENVPARSNNIWENKGKKKPKRSHLMNAESTQKALKILNFTTTYTIMMKLTADIYLNKVFHLAKSWDVIYKVSEGINKKISQNEPKKSVFWRNFDHFLILQ